MSGGPAPCQAQRYTLYSFHLSGPAALFTDEEAEAWGQGGVGREGCPGSYREGVNGPKATLCLLPFSGTAQSGLAGHQSFVLHHKCQCHIYVLFSQFST